MEGLLITGPVREGMLRTSISQGVVQSAVILARGLRGGSEDD